MEIIKKHCWKLVHSTATGEREENKNRFSKLASFFKSRKSVNYIGKIGQSVFVIHTQDLI